MQWNVFINRLELLNNLNKIEDAVIYIKEHLKDNFMFVLTRERKNYYFKERIRLLKNSIQFIINSLSFLLRLIISFIR
jgi:hypothetical protein